MAVLAAIVSGCSQENATTSLSGTAEAKDPKPHGKAISVQTVTPTRRNLMTKFEQPAPVAACEEAELFARASGYVSKVHVDIGDAVEEGALLLELEVDDLVQDLAYKEALTRQAIAERDQAEAAVRAAEAALDAWPSLRDQAEAEVRRAESLKDFRERHLQRFVQLASREAATVDLVDEKREQSQAAFADWETAVAKNHAIQNQKVALTAKRDESKALLETRKRHVEVAEADRNRTKVLIEYTRIKAPFSGVITHRNVDPGTLVTAGATGRAEPILQIACLDRMSAVLRVPEREVGRIRTGTKAVLKLDSLEGGVVQGTVSRFSKLLDEKSRTMRVEVDIENPDHRIYPGMYGPVMLVLQEIDQAITIPATAVYAVGGESFVIEVKDGRTRRVTVKTGYDDGKIVQVVEGLTGDEEVVVSNKGQIADGQAVVSHRVDVAQSE